MGINYSKTAPIGLLELDPTNPLTKHIVIAMHAGKEYVSGNYLEPVNQYGSSNSGSNVGALGREIESHSTTDGGFSVHVPQFRDRLDGTTNISVCVHAAIDSAASWGGFTLSPSSLGSWPAPYQQLGFVRSSGSTAVNFHVAVGGGTGFNQMISGSGFLDIDGTDHCYVAVKDDTTTCRFYKDGIQHSTEVNNLNDDPVTFVSTHDKMFFMSRNDSATGEGLNGREALVLWFDIALSAEQAASVSEFPWQFFRKRRQRSVKLSVSTSVGVTLALAKGIYADTGYNVGLAVRRNLDLAKGAYSDTGYSAGLLVSRKIDLSKGSYSYTGYSLDITSGGTLALDKGSYAQTGHDVALVVNKKLDLLKGSYSDTGYDVGLTGAATYTISLNKGSYSDTGYNLDFGRHYIAALGKGSYILTGHAVTISLYIPKVKPKSAASFKKKDMATEMAVANKHQYTMYETYRFGGGSEMYKDKIGAAEPLFAGRRRK